MRILFITLFFTLMVHADFDVDTNTADVNSSDVNTTESFKSSSLKDGKTAFLTVKDSKLEGQVVGLT